MLESECNEVRDGLFFGVRSSGMENFCEELAVREQHSA